MKCHLLLFLLLGNILFAQQYDFKTYSTKSGLAGSTVNSIFQDKHGYIWFAAQGAGVSRFDGRRFKKISKADGLIANDVSSICGDNEGNIWFATTEGISKYDGTLFTNYSEKEGLASKFINFIYCDTKGMMWICTNAGISCYDGKKFNNYGIKEGLPGNAVFCMLQDDKGIYWIGTNKGLCEYDGKKFTCFSLNTISAISCIMQDNSGKLWLGMGNGEIGIFDGEKIVKPAIDHLPNLEFISQIIEDKHNNIWMATYKGLLKISGSSYQLFSEKEGLTSNKVNALREDYEGNIWIGTFNGGACLFKNEAFVTFSVKEGLTHKNITSIVKDSQGNYLVGTGEGLNIYDGSSFSYTDYIPELKDCNVIALYNDHKGRIWVGTENKGVIVLHYQKGKYIKERSIQKLNGDELLIVTKIIEDTNKNMWISSFAGGVYVLHEDGSSINYNSNNELPSDNVTGLYEDYNGNIWIASIEGVTKFNGTTFTTLNTKNGLPDNIVTPIIEMNGVMLFGTAQAGIACYDGKNISTISSVNGLNSNNITAIIRDKDDYLWIGTDKGLDKLRLTKNFMEAAFVKHYTEQQGFKGSEINPYALYMDNNNNIWIGTIEGLVRYNPAMDFSKTIPPKIELTGIELFYENVDWKKHSEKIDNKTGLPENLTLSYKNNNLTFIFQALTTADVNYSYMLEGLDDSWSPIRNNNEAVYPNISPGTYTFKVRALNGDNLWSQNIVSYHVIITPPFYKTWWFYSFSAVAMSFSVWAFINWRTKKIIKEKELLEEIVKDRTAEVVRQKKEAEKQRDIVEEKNHEITDSINYAKRIQNAILPNLEQVYQTLPQSFVLFKPKDIVSGDFYWYQSGQGILIAAADCTGHGVPGAFMSTIGVEKLNEAAKQSSYPGKILHLLNRSIRNSLHQGENLNMNEQASRDGMDIALVNLKTNSDSAELYFAGANRPLWLIRKGAAEIEEIKATKSAIGGITNDTQHFQTHELQLKKGDTFYIFSDGYADQFSLQDKKLMTRRFKTMLMQIQSHAMQNQKKYLESFIDYWKGDLEQTDDILVIGVRV